MVERLVLDGKRVTGLVHAPARRSSAPCGAAREVILAAGAIG